MKLFTPTTLLATSLLTLASCGIFDSLHGQDSLVSMIDEPPGANCSNGGIAVQSGVDANNNGVLDPDEISATDYVCDGAGHSALVLTQAEPPGVNCEQGGVAILSGLDVNDDGALQDEEITATQYVCDGNGHSALISPQEEPPGIHCAEGGVAVSFGVDTNDNGVLDPEEITATQYICNGSSGLNTLVSLQVEPEGANCTFAGQAIRTGLDLNRDGLLQFEEVQFTSYLCNGAPGLLSLLRLEDERPGLNCPAGGKALLSGLDLDANGYLEAAEVSSTSYVCNGEQGAPGHSSLFTLTPAAPGLLCLAGGFALQSGLDINDSGVLEPNEVTQLNYICHGSDGADGLNALVSLLTEPPGANCAEGGTKIATGLDTNRDGALNPNEVTQSGYVCNGADGSNSLVKVSAEPAGATCTNGGQKLEAGIDDNQNGTLEPAEVDATSYVCHGGNVVLRISNAAWGGVCTRGGVKVETGVDDNGNGTLDDAEVDRTQYACNLFFSQVDGGDQHTCAVISDGTARCWGYNGYGQLGDGTNTIRLTPVSVSGLSGVVEIAAGYLHTCARLSDGTAKCWGWNGHGQLGDGSFTDRSTPVAVSGLSGVTQLSSGSAHSCAVLSNGTAKCWGNNYYGQLGDGTIIDHTTPVTVSGLTTAAQLSAGDGHTCAVLSAGTVKCWGYNDYGQLGDNTTTDRYTPVTVSGLSAVSQISVGMAHSCARLTNSTAKCWGNNYYGTLGDGTTTDRHTPVLVGALNTVSQIAAGGMHSCANLTYGTACWGYNSNGQLGDNSTTNRNTPVMAIGLPGIVGLAGGGYYSCAVVSDGTARCWGSNMSGQLGDGTTSDRLVAALVQWSIAP